MLSRLWHKLPFTGAAKPFVSVIFLSGVIAPESKSRSSINLPSIIKALNKAFSQADARAVVLVINSPGGSPAQSRMILERIRALAAEKKKPVLTYIEDIGASGGYMLALAGDEIIADPFAIVGSIGVITATFGFDEAIERLGIDRRVYTAGENKSQLDPFQPENKADVERLKHILDQSHSLFIKMVKDRRGDRLKGDESDLFSGNFWIAGEALERGLIDHTGDLRAMLQARYGEDVELRRIDTEKKTLLTKFIGMQAPALGAGDIRHAIIEHMHWARFGK